ncbi:MAG TPA: hypothetical protein PLH93_00165 [Flavobacteriales bacterium]|nr:hypothetical protein [Flavobacteriales bacterium]
MRAALFVLGLLTIAQATAQYAIGITVGAAHLDLQERKRKNTSGRLHFDGVDQPAWSMAVFYREHAPGRVHLGGELQVDRRRFSASWSDGGLGPGESTTASVELYTVRLALLPEVDLDRAGTTRVRFGFALGAVVAGRMNGTRSYWGLNGWVNETLVNADPKGFGGELRALLGLGIRLPLTAGGELVIDPFTALSLAPMIRTGGGSRSWESGVRLGWAFTTKRMALTEWMRPPVR